MSGAPGADFLKDVGGGAELGDVEIDPQFVVATGEEAGAVKGDEQVAGELVLRHYLTDVLFIAFEALGEVDLVFQLGDVVEEVDGFGDGGAGEERAGEVCKAGELGVLHAGVGGYADALHGDVAAAADEVFDEGPPIGLGHAVEVVEVVVDGDADAGARELFDDAFDTALELGAVDGFHARGGKESVGIVRVIDVWNLGREGVAACEGEGEYDGPAGGLRGDLDGHAPLAQLQLGREHLNIGIFNGVGFNGERGDWPHDNIGPEGLAGDGGLGDGGQAGQGGLRSDEGDLNIGQVKGGLLAFAFVGAEGGVELGLVKFAEGLAGGFVAQGDGVFAGEEPSWIEGKIKPGPEPDGFLMGAEVDPAVVDDMAV